VNLAADTKVIFDRVVSSGGSASTLTAATVIGATVAQSDIEFGPI
jgi:hypothetical protein